MTTCPPGQMSFASPLAGLNVFPLQLTNALVVPKLSGMGRPCAAGLVIAAGRVKVKFSDAFGSASHCHWANELADVDTVPWVLVTVPNEMPASFTHDRNGAKVNVTGAEEFCDGCANTGMANNASAAKARVRIFRMSATPVLWNVGLQEGNCYGRMVTDPPFIWWVC